MPDLVSHRPSWALLDRDGTVNEKAAEGDYVSDPREVRLIAGAASAVRRLNQALEAVAVVTNQRGVARGMFTLSAVTTVNDRVNTLLAAEDAHVDAFFVCPHDLGECACRKPEPGLFVAAAELFGLPLNQAVVIGDSEADVAAGNAIGALAIRLAPPGVPSSASHIVPHISDAVDLVLSGT